MISFFYAKNNPFFRIITLALGLALSSVLFSYIAFFLNTNTYFGEYENLYAIDRNLVVGYQESNTNMIFAPIPSALRNTLPEIVSATVCSRTNDCSFTYQNHDYPSQMIMADSCFFETMGIRILEGDSKQLGLQNHIFISDKLAKAMFKDESPVGSQILFYNVIPYTVAGVFEHVENSTLQFEAVLSFVNVSNQFGYYCGWNGGDSFQGYVRLLPEIPYRQVSDKLQSVILSHIEPMEGYEESFFLIPITDLATKKDNTPLFLFILNLLAVAVLTICTFNYILSVLSTLPLRIKSIGIYKSCGASKLSIFKMFLAETGCIIVAAVGISSILVYMMNEPIETFTGLTLPVLFSWDNMRLPFLTLLDAAFTAEVVPGIVLARTPTNLFFSAKTTGKQIWKKLLLFVQITGAAIILPLLTVTIQQYYYLTNKPLGYDSENILYANLGGRLQSDEQINTLLSELKRFPYVASVATSEDFIGGYSGNPVWDDEENTLFITRLTAFDSCYIPTLNINIVEGRNLQGEGEMLVNETFAKKYSPNESIIGKTPLHYEKRGKIVGVTADYSFASLYSEIQPLLVFGKVPMKNGILFVRLSEITPERLKQLNSRLAELVADNDIGFTVQSDVLRSSYEPARQFRNVIGYTALVIFIIVFIGLFVYIDNEITRKTKEIAIRKVNGASVSDILKIMLSDIVLALVPAVITGSIIAVPIVQYWLEQFAYKTEVSWVLYASAGFVIFASVCICTIIKSWNTANSNPVKHLKSE